MFLLISYIGRLVALGACVCVLLTCCSSFKSNLTTDWRVLSQRSVGHPPPFTSLIFFDELNGLGLTPLGLGGTTDGGSTWTWRLEDGNRGLYSMRFVDRQGGWIVGAESKATEEDSAISQRNHKPFILRTEDGGTTWRDVDLDQFLRSEGTRFSSFFSICTSRGGATWLAGDAGIVEATIESDKLRTRQLTVARATVRDLWCNESEEVWAVGDEGLIMHYREGKWTSIQYPDGNAFYSRIKVIGKAIWLVGGTREKGQDQVKGLLLNSDNGYAWENKTPRDAGLLFDFDLSQNEGWLVGAQGNIYHTSDGGSAWEKETSPTENDLLSIFLLKGTRGWIGGDKMTVLGRSIH